VSPSAQADPRVAPAAATSRDVPWTVLEGDCRERLAQLKPASVDAVVTDPPYGIGFQGERWDGQAIREAAIRRTNGLLSAGEAFEAWAREWARDCLRVLRPGAHLTAFGAPRTAHRLACALEDAGFELRDTLLWLYGTGMPKSRRLPGGRATSLKPAYEPILLARKPLDGTIEQNLKAHRTGALNADACRVDERFPANVVLTHHVGCAEGRCRRGCPARLIDSAAERTRARSRSAQPASRLFYCPKVSRRERNAGCEGLPRRKLDLFPNAGGATAPAAAAANPHPTVKPLEVMRWLVRLVSPPAGLVLDPFCGSGSTGAAAALEGCRFLGVELEPDYASIARARIAHWSGRRGNESDACPFARQT